jgi:hypothetical protein
MSAQQAAATASSRVWTQPLVRATGGALVLALAAWFTYRAVEHRIVGSPHYTIDPRTIEVTEQPKWIRSDVKAEVLRDGSLDQPLNLLDDSLPERVSKAFTLHPWVAQVTSVRKRAGKGLEVELLYRRPVCMVEVPGGLYPVDADGVLLPTADFTPQDASHYPRLTGIQTVTEGPVGTRWQDACVQGAAQIAALLADDWAALGLARISPLAGGPAAAGDELSFVLYSQSGASIVWGAATSAGDSEPTGEDKLARLKTLASALRARNGSSPPLDLRTQR